MNVHLLRAPDYDKKDYDKVFNLLTNLNMPGWTFYAVEPFQFPEEVYFRYDTPNENTLTTTRIRLPWSVLFGLCKHYRKQQGARVGDTDVVIALTSMPNALNWFSMFNIKHNPKDIFIHADPLEWKQYLPCSHEYPVAHQIISNSLQQAMNLDLESDPCIHKNPIGCMNDFCGYKMDIALQMQTALICTRCQQRLMENMVGGLVVNGALESFEKLRKKMRPETIINPGLISVREVGGRFMIFIGDHNNGNLKEVRLPTVVANTLYIFYLIRQKQHPGDGVSRQDLSLEDNRTKLESLHLRLDYGTDMNQLLTHAQQQIGFLVSESDEFSQQKYRANRALIDALGVGLAKYYIIEGGRGERFKINLQPNLIDLPDEFLAHD